MQLKIIDDENASWISSCEHCHYGKEFGSNMYCAKRKEVKYRFDWCSHWEKKENKPDDILFSTVT
jgi:hypothetical protein